MPLFNPTGYDYLGSVVLGSAAASTAALTIEARDVLLIQARITGYGGADIAALRFNADATTTNYRSRWVTYSNVAVPINAGIDTAASAMVLLGPTGITLGRSVLLGITNLSSVNKTMWIQSAEEVAAQATVPPVALGWGEWFNTAAQITSIDMRTNGGQNLNTGSGFAVFGRNL